MFWSVYRILLQTLSKTSDYTAPLFYTVQNNHTFDCSLGTSSCLFALPLTFGKRSSISRLAFDDVKPRRGQLQ